MKIYLSPSNQSENLYAGSISNEAHECRKIAAATEAALVRCGFEVMCTNPEDMYTAVKESDDFGADYHICIHTNAFNGQVTGTRLFCFSTESNGYSACKAIMKELAPLTPGTSDNITPYPALYEVRQPAAYTVYIEVGFHDKLPEATWIVENTQAIGEAICRGMCAHAGVPYVARETEPLYRVQIGAFRKLENAQNQVRRAQDAGFTDAFIVREN